jgi:hypothetical protein
MSAHPPASRQALWLLLCLAAIGGAAYSIYRTQFAAPKFNVGLHQAVGRALAEQTARAINNSGKVVAVAIELAGAPELKPQLDEFELALRRFPRVRLEKCYRLETDDQPKYSFGSGLSGRRFVRLVNKNTSADAIVSFVGVPTLSPAEVTELKAHPKFIAESRAADKLKPLFEQHLLEAAVVSRFQFPAPRNGPPRSAQEMFDLHFQIVTSADAGKLPTGKGE